MENKLTARALNAKLPYTFANEIDYLEDIAKGLSKDSFCIMLGAGPGIMSIALLQANPDISLWAVDNNQAVLDTYVAHLSAAGIWHSRIYLGDTTDLASMGIIPEVDLLIIDADHSYEGVLRDIEAWWPKVKVGGTVFFHDYIDIEMNGTNGVARAIKYAGTTFKLSYEHIGYPGISLVVRKTE